MKCIIIVLFLFASCAASGQVDSLVEARFAAYIKGPYNIGYSNHTSFLNRVVQLVGLDNIDSSREAMRIMHALKYYDSVKYSDKVFVPLLKKIEKSTGSYLDAALVGRWRFAWGGTNWGAAFTAKDTTRQLVFTGSDLVFYTGDTVKRKTAYRLVNAAPYGLPRNPWYATAFRIRLEDSGEEWSFQVTREGQFAPYIGNALTASLHLNLMVNCVCGCPEEMYKKL
jgi:hypothetical protein